MPARSIAIVSSGSGAGRTMLALNLALALNGMNHKVLLFDADFTKENMLEHLGVHDVHSDIGKVLDGESHINDSVYRHITGLRVIPSKVHEYDGFSHYYQDLLGDYDYIILDTPMHPQHLETVLGNADEALIVHSPQHSVKGVSDAMALLSRLKVLNLGVVLNNFSEQSTDTLLGHPVLEKIPPSKDIAKSFALKNPVFYTHPRSPVNEKFKRLARRVG